MMIKKGIDFVGSFADVDYAKLKAAGVDFAIIKISQGTWWAKADNWKKHADGFKKVGIKVGFYFYSEATDAASTKAETEYFLKILGNYKPDFGCWWDIEGTAAYNLAAKGIGLACLKEFKKLIEAKGMVWGVYTNMNNNLKPLFGSYQTVKNLGGYVWVANYPVNGPGWETGLRSKAYTCDIWQQSENGRLDGFGANADLDICYAPELFGEPKNADELRARVVGTAENWIGINEADGTHVFLNELYNSQKVLPRGYAMKPEDDWCAEFASDVALRCGLTDIMPTEVSCEKMVELYKKLGRWVENDGYYPKPGDLIFYDWDDSGKGDNTGNSDHVGIVAEVDGDNITVIEGNISDSVGRRAVKVNNRYIRGYGVPDYESLVELDIGNPSAWARESCLKAVKTGVVHGDGLGVWDWDKPITKEQICVLFDNLGFFEGYSIIK